MRQEQSCPRRSRSDSGHADAPESLRLIWPLLTRLGLRSVAAAAAAYSLMKDPSADMTSPTSLE